MTQFKKLKLIGSFLCLFMVSGGSMLTLNSCIKDADEPYFENTDDKDPSGDDQDPGNDNPDDPGDEGDEGNGDENKPGEDNPGEDNPGETPEITDNIKNLTLGQNLSTTAVVMAQNARGLVISDKGGSIYLYNTSLNFASYPIGTIVAVEGEVKNFGTGLQFDNTAKISVVGKETVTYPTPTVYTAAMVDAAVANTNYVTSTYVTLEGQYNISGNYSNIIIEGASVQGSVSYPSEELKSKLKDGSTYSFTGYFTGISGTNTKYFNIVVTETKEINGNQGGNTDPGTTVEVPAVFKSEPYGYVVLPAGIPEQYKGYTGFNVSFNKDNHTPNYVAWELLSEETKALIPRKDDWHRDSSVEGCPDKDYDFANTGYQRGHMCPSAEQRWSAEALYDSCVMTNVCPQLPSLNEKLWATLEDKERDWAVKYGSIYIVCGPIYEETDTQRIGNYKVRVPSAFFKAFLYYNGVNSRTIAYVMQNGDNPGDLNKYAITVDKLEEITGYDFFSALPDDIENAIEATYDLSKWN